MMTENRTEVYDDDEYVERDEQHPGEKKVPWLVSMNDTIVRNHMDAIREAVNTAIDNGTLPEMIECMILNRVEKPDIHLMDFAYYRRDRSRSEADIRLWIPLTIREEDGRICEIICDLGITANIDFRTWNFEVLDIWDAGDAPDRKRCWMMDEYGVLFIPAAMKETRAENIWKEHMECGLYDSQARSGVMLALELGMEIERSEAYLEPFIRFEKERTVLCLKTEDDNDLEILDHCIRYEWLYSFFRIQGMDTDRFERIPKKWIPEDARINDSFRIAVMQAGRGAYSLLMPEDFVKDFVRNNAARAAKAKRFHGYHNHKAAVLENVAREMNNQLPELRLNWIRTRFIQIIDASARAIFNWTDGHTIDAYGFMSDALKSQDYSLAIGTRSRAIGMYYRDPLFREVMETGDYVFADGLIVRNHPDFVMMTANGIRMTPFANLEADACSLRFRTRWNGRYKTPLYYFGKENYELVKPQDPEVAASREARLQRLRGFESVHELISDLVQTNGDLPGISRRSLIPADRIEDLCRGEMSRYYRDEMLALCTGLSLEPKISFLLFDRAGIALENDAGKDPGMRKALLCLFFTDTVDNLRSYLENEKFNSLGIRGLNLYEWRRAGNE